jgi:transcriptional regulator with XRE-family HTH domain
MATGQPTPGAYRLADRLRELRERASMRLTQGDLGKALGGAHEQLSPTTISMWENPASGRIVPRSRLEAYARLFCTQRSFEGGVVHMVDVAELTAAERDRMQELRRELLTLRDSAVPREGGVSSGKAQSMWHFPDGSQITLVCYRMPPDRQPKSADPSELDYVRFSDLADLDSLIEIYGAVRAYNPTSRIVITAAQDLTQRDVANHLVLIGGRTWQAVAPWLTGIFPIPVELEDPAERDAIVVHDPEHGEREFKYTLVNGQLVQDVGLFARGENPSAPRRTLTICGGITTRGVRGAARCFIDGEMREHNERYLIPRFPHGSTYCIVMKVPVVNLDPLTPDLSKEDNRLFEWCDASPEAA